MSDLQTLVVFSIGNPGPVSRHSCGHLVLERLIEHFGAEELAKSGSYSSTAADNVFFVRSNTSMNESEKAFKKFFGGKIRPDRCVTAVLYDDFEMDLGKVKLSKFKKNESHNGLKSSNRFLKGFENVYKLGIGIGPKPSNATRDSMGDWVLSSFKPQEKQILELKSIPLAIDYIEYIIEVEGDIASCEKVNSYFTKLSRAV